MAKAPDTKEVNGVTRQDDGTVVYRVRFEGETPVYPDGFGWEDGRTYAHVQAGGGWTDADLFTSEAQFLESVKADPPAQGWTRLVAVLPLPPATAAAPVAFAISGRDFFAALDALRPSVDRRTTIPILSCVRITGWANRLAFEGTNLDLSYHFDIDGVFPAFDVCTDFWKLHRFVSMMRTSDFTVEVGQVMTLKGFRYATPDGVSFELMSAKDFPEPPVREYAAEIDLDPSVIRKIRAAISTEETRYYLNGILFDGQTPGNPFLRLVATDGHRLNMVQTGISYSGPNVIVPRSLAIWLSAQQPGHLALGQTGICWRREGLTVWAKTIDGKFPDYNRVLPGAAEFTATLQRRDFLDVLGVLRKFLTAGERSLRLTFKDQALTLSHTSVHGKLALHMDGIAHTEGLPFDIGLNGKYLTELLDTVKAEEFTFECTDASAPIRVAEGDVTCILMPVRV